MDISNLLSGTVPATFVIGPLVILIIMLVVMAARKASPVTPSVVPGAVVSPQSTQTVSPQTNSITSAPTPTAVPITSTAPSTAPQVAETSQLPPVTQAPAATPIPEPVSIPQPVAVPTPTPTSPPLPVSVATSEVLQESALDSTSQSTIATIPSEKPPTIQEVEPSQVEVSSVQGSSFITVSDGVATALPEQVTPISPTSSSISTENIPPVASWKPVGQATPSVDQTDTEAGKQAQAQA